MHYNLKERRILVSENLAHLIQQSYAYRDVNTGEKLLAIETYICILEQAASSDKAAIERAKVALNERDALIAQLQATNRQLQLNHFEPQGEKKDETY